MIPIRSWRDRRVALFGLGGSGLVTAEALAAGGADVTAYDDSEAACARAAAAGIRVADLRGLDWTRIDALVLAPGVPLTHPEPHWSARLANDHGVRIIGDVGLFVEERRARCPAAALVAITGTNGKSTTTALISHLLTAAGRDVQMGGNIGRAILSLDDLSPDRTYVVECSSFQIDLAPGLDATVGVHLNLSEDHLDRHGTMANYAAIKERLVMQATTAVVGVDDAMSAAIAGRISEAGHKLVPISARSALRGGVYFAEGRVHAPDGGMFYLTGIGSLRGAHKGQNAAAAVATVKALGVDDATIQTALKSFPGLPHRMEEVGRRGSGLFINDSKATNADSSAQALAAFRDVHWIIGGKAKAGGIASLDGFFDRVARAYLIGAATEEFAATLEGRVPYERCGTLDVAVARAAAEAAASAAAEPVVLLSPACASYDQFKNFEVRGDQFRELVRALPGIERA